MTKKIHNIGTERALRQIAVPSGFDRIVNEIDANEIPADYIERIVVYYKNGTVIELSGEEISHPVPVNQQGTWDDVEEYFNQMREVKIFVNTGKLEKDINEKVDAILNRI